MNERGGSMPEFWDVVQWGLSGMVLPLFFYFGVKQREIDKERASMRTDLAVLVKVVDAMQKTHENELGRFQVAVTNIAHSLEQHRTEMRDEVKALRAEMVGALNRIGDSVVHLLKDGK